MKINCYSVTFWFNIFEKHNEILNILQDEFNDEFKQINLLKITNNLLAPVINSVNNEIKTNFSFSQINFQYNMDNVSLGDITIFKEKVMKIFEMLNQFTEVKHVSVYFNGEIIDDEALNKLSELTLKENLVDDDLVDISLKIGKKNEDLFYKVINVLNKKQIKLPQKVDESGKIIPIPLISWHGALVENEIIEISYEINDKYLFDFTKDYHTTEFYLNKMLYIFGEDIKEDLNDLINLN